MPHVSIVIPVYQMSDAIPFLKRNLDSILSQTYKDYEIVVSDDSDSDSLKNAFKDFPVKWFKNKGPKGMANNTNHAIDKASGELVKILFQDDYFLNEYSLENIIHYFTPHTNWLVTGCIHTFDGQAFINPHKPFYSESENTIGSPSVLTFRRKSPLRFDPKFSWVLDLDLYRQFFKKYGRPTVLNEINTVIGLHEGQMTNKLSDEQKLKEFQLLKQKHE